MHMYNGYGCPIHLLASAAEPHSQIRQDGCPRQVSCQRAERLATHQWGLLKVDKVHLQHLGEGQVFEEDGAIPRC